MSISQYIEDIILSKGGNEENIKDIENEVKQNGFTIIEEVKSYLERMVD